MILKFNKSDKKRFQKEITNFFAEHDDNTVEKGTRILFNIPTIYGNYEVREIDTEGNCLSVFGAFTADDVSILEKASKAVDSNRYSGKWNFHYSRGLNKEDDVIDNIVYAIIEEFKDIMNVPKEV